jgi:DNA polymerase-3 subunit beta
MELTVATSDLLKELEAAITAVERKSAIPILSNVLLKADMEKLHLAATDLDSSLRTSCPAKVKKPGAVTAPARKLYDYVKLLPDGDVSLKTGENNWLHIRTKASTTRMVGMAPNNFPSLPDFPGGNLAMIEADKFRSLIAKTLFCVAAQESRYTLNGALVIITQKSVQMIATDGHRLAQAEIKASTGVSKDRRFILPRRTMTELATLLRSAEDEIEIAEDESSLFFRMDGRLLTSRKLTGQFPNYDQVIPRDGDKIVTIGVTELQAALMRVAEFADERSNSIRLALNPDSLALKAATADCGESEDELQIAYKGDSLVIGFNSKYLLDFLKTVPEGEVKLQFKSKDAAGLFMPAEVEDGSYKYVIMPMRV